MKQPNILTTFDKFHVDDYCVMIETDYILDYDLYNFVQCKFTVITDE
jgi:hypothetical protein